MYCTVCAQTNKKVIPTAHFHFTQDIALSCCTATRVVTKVIFLFREIRNKCKSEFNSRNFMAFGAVPDPMPTPLGRARSFGYPLSPNGSFALRAKLLIPFLMTF
jgi:hypothetical protein